MRKLSPKTCPACKSRATKIISLNTGLFKCQICENEYDPYPERKTEEPTDDIQ